jgi:hypothetical protein
MHSLIGTWIANIAKSRRHENHQFASATMHFAIAQDEVRLSYEGVNASGNVEKSEQVLQADGLPHAHPLAPDIVVTNSLSARGFESIATKHGAPMGHGSYDVSDDGSTLTATVRGIDGSGKAFEQVIVFDRAQPAVANAAG